MKTDSIFYQLFQNFPSIFFELIGESAVTGDIYKFTSVEIKQTAFRIDGVFLPNVDSDSQLIYFVEVQFQLDPRFYSRFISEVFLYFRQYDLPNDWRAVVLYPQRSLDPEVPIQYRGLLLTEQIQRVYLDELGENATLPLGVGVVQLVVESEETAIASARKLIDQARQELADELTQGRIIELIETIVFYKFPQKSRQEIAAMFGLSELKQTRVYQEIKEEALLETVPRLLAMGLTVEQIAEALSLSVEQVQQAATKQTSD
ncbi:Rpn family recombination-promoting nuclease/putative transposase [Nostoc sp. FACHB-152]|uniref:Rpn family recombination-promoting nuclease/putative transposase n=1 Tax=unclassified Nostoc TaxID=2593658 RepID=UPI001687D692|nr:MULTISPECIES: Rpn family recombination-promoting nuclease/putative transposase [unclassified Nostoc]MBD2448858.1 Rpn family recombination-promoting nuclease/putative transposase [Nostoc sp. FACHB-152]MBD2469811.1 Rpn family recombination-promoting nuclease/putative transposase [Nostoc sp. FACHB-145]